MSVAFKASVFVVLQKPSSKQVFYLLLLLHALNFHHVFVLSTVYLPLQKYKSDWKPPFLGIPTVHICIFEQYLNSTVFFR